MTSAQPLDIKVVYTASRRKNRGKRASGSVARSGRPWIFVGIGNLLIAAALCYGTWWRVDPFIYITLLWKTPIPELDINAVAAGMFGISAEGGAAPGGHAQERAAASNSGPAAAPHRFTGETARNIMGISGYAWLALATLAACALAIAGGASLVRSLGRPGRRLGAVLAGLSFLALGWWGYGVWAEFGIRYTPTHLRTGMSALVALAAVSGTALGRGSRGLTRSAAILLILSAVGSVAALTLGSLCGAIAAERSSIPFLAGVFVVQSSYAWIILPITARLAR